ncbi:hypothetical protein HYW75_05525 [Candidatus Pacearchaeota archaeon]|nr:hypothetical protein [Candidatus Pacearchaeota archaeon]
MTIRHKGSKIFREETFNQSDIYGRLGALSVAIFGGPRMSSVVVNPETEAVTINASYGSYTVEKSEINSDSTCRQLKLHYSQY